MKERWTDLLGTAERLLPSYLAAVGDLSHAHKGIRRSELFFFYTLVAPGNPARIIESGRARGQSTIVLSRLFPETAIVSLESDAGSPDAKVAAERLRDCRNVDCRFGDSLLLLPEMVEQKDVVLIDGPKDFRALKLAFRLLRTGKPSAVFVHDLWLGSPPRHFVDRHLPSAFLSDDARWVERHAQLDSRKNIPPRDSSGKKTAYGATLGCFQAGAENYGRRLRQCSAAQGADRLRETVRKILRRPARVRPRDFAAP
ncbi:MAG TPA: hypothetical protein VGF73_11195 [Chthoniobacterales bacterium]